MVHSFTQNEIENGIKENLSDDYTTPNSLDESGLDDFFSKKGAIEVLILLAENPKPFQRINDLIPASQTTISKRLSEGVSLGLWGEDVLYFDNNKRVNLYRLADEANKIAEVVRNKDAYETYMEYIRAKNNFEELTSEVKKDIAQKTDE